MAQKIRIRLKSYDHQALDKSSGQIVETVQRSGATVTGVTSPVSSSKSWVMPSFLPRIAFTA